MVGSCSIIFRHPWVQYSTVSAFPSARRPVAGRVSAGLAPAAGAYVRPRARVPCSYLSRRRERGAWRLLQIVCICMALGGPLLDSRGCRTAEDVVYPLHGKRTFSFSFSTIDDLDWISNITLQTHSSYHFICFVSKYGFFFYPSLRVVVVVLLLLFFSSLILNWFYRYIILVLQILRKILFLFFEETTLSFNLFNQSNNNMFSNLNLNLTSFTCIPDTRRVWVSVCRTKTIAHHHHHHHHHHY